MTEIDTCPLCGQTGTHKPHLSARDTLVSKESFSITQCSNCDLLITNPRPKVEEAAKYYQSTAYVSHTDARRSMQDVLYAWIKGLMTRRKLHWIKNHQYAQNPRLLDYGCGTGDFVLYAGKQGFHASGIEPNADARKLALNKGVDVYSALERLDKETSFDVITLWHVLEHVPNVQEVLQQLHEKLNANGLLVLAVPMATSYDAIHYKSDWAAWDLPRHLFHFTPKTLHALAKQVKLEHVATYPLPFDAWYISLLSEQQKHQNANVQREKPSKPGPLRLLSAARTAMVSNYRARRKKSPWSSQAFIYRKK